MTRKPVQELSGLCVRAQAAEKVDVVALYQKAELRPREAYIGITTRSSSFHLVLPLLIELF